MSLLPVATNQIFIFRPSQEKGQFKSDCFTMHLVLQSTKRQPAAMSLQPNHSIRNRPSLLHFVAEIRSLDLMGYCITPHLLCLVMSDQLVVFLLKLFFNSVFITEDYKVISKGTLLNIDAAFFFFVKNTRWKGMIFFLIYVLHQVYKNMNPMQIKCSLNDCLNFL